MKMQNQFFPEQFAFQPLVQRIEGRIHIFWEELLREDVFAKSMGVGAEDRPQNSFTFLWPLKDLKGPGVAPPRISGFAAVLLSPLVLCSLHSLLLPQDGGGLSSRGLRNVFVSPLPSPVRDWRQLSVCHPFSYCWLQLSP